MKYDSLISEDTTLPILEHVREPTQAGELILLHLTSLDNARLLEPAVRYSFTVHCSLRRVLEERSDMILLGQDA